MASMVQILMFHVHLSFPSDCELLKNRSHVWIAICPSLAHHQENSRFFIKCDHFCTILRCPYGSPYSNVHPLPQTTVLLVSTATRQYHRDRHSDTSEVFYWSSSHRTCPDWTRMDIDLPSHWESVKEFVAICKPPHSIHQSLLNEEWL